MNQSFKSFTKTRPLALGLVALALVAAPAAAQEPLAGGAAADLLHRESLSDDWFGLGRQLDQYGLTVALVGGYVYQQNVHGGLSTHRRAGRNSVRYDLEINANLEALAGLPGASIFALARGGACDGIDEAAVGSLYGVNCLPTGDRAIDLWQLYYAQSLLEDRLILQVGKFDLTNGFDTNAYANDELAQFLNCALVNNPTIPFTDPGLGAGVYLQPHELFYLAAAVADAEADYRETGFNTAFHGDDHFLTLVEAGLTPAPGGLEGAYRVGLWYDPQPKDHLAGPLAKRDDVGVYASFDQRLTREAAPAAPDAAEGETEDDGQGLGVFARLGAADSKVNEIRCFASAGAQYQGLIPGRDADVLGLGVAWGDLSPDAGYSAAHETAMELYYNLQPTPWLSITPSAQYILHPGGDSDADDAVILGLRAVMVF